MREPIGQEEFASLSGISTELIEDYRSRGLLDADGDGLFDGYDLLRLQFVTAQLEQGLPLEQILETANVKEEAFVRRLFPQNRRVYTHEEAAAEIGISPEALADLGTASGLLSGTFDEEDLRALKSVVDALSGFLPWEALIEGARVYGDSLRRLAESEVHMMHYWVCEPLTRQGINDREVLAVLRGKGSEITPLLEDFMRHMHQDYLIRAIIDHYLFHLEGREPSSVQGSFEATVLFIDLALFTSLAEVHGDDVAAETLGKVDGIIRRLAMEYSGEIAKQIGDAFMLAFDRPVDSVRFALDLGREAERGDNLPAMRIGIHSGPVLHRWGEYVGHTVNVASRVAGMAMPDTILVTEPVAAAARNEGIVVEPIGVRRARGLEEPIPLFRVASEVPSKKQRDPVCGMMVEPPGVGRIVHDGEEFYFCSHDCLRRFLDAPAEFARRRAG